MGKIRHIAITAEDPFVTAELFKKALGLENDMSAGGMGIRSKRYSMLIEDGKVTQLNLETVPGQAEVSGAATLLGQL